MLQHLRHHSVTHLPVGERKSVCKSIDNRRLWVYSRYLLQKALSKLCCGFDARDVHACANKLRRETTVGAADVNDPLAHSHRKHVKSDVTDSADHAAGQNELDISRSGTDTGGTKDALTNAF